MSIFDTLAKAFGPAPMPAQVPATEDHAAVPHASPEIVVSPVVFKPTQVNKVQGEVGGLGEAFDKAFVHAMKWETGLHIDLNDPEIQQGLISTPAQRKKVGYTDGITGASRFDSGGETKFGVAQKAHPELTVRTITLAQAELVYKKGYWDAVKGDELHPDVARYVFDIGCGSGPQKGIKLLQQACGVTVDGNLGPATLAAANAMPPAVLVNSLMQLRMNFYRAIVANNPSQGIFLQGWLNRAADLS